MATPTVFSFNELESAAAKGRQHVQCKLGGGEGAVEVRLESVAPDLAMKDFECEDEKCPCIDIDKELRFDQIAVAKTDARGDGRFEMEGYGLIPLTQGQFMEVQPQYRHHCTSLPSQ